VVKAYTDNESLLIAFDRAKSLVDSKAECNVALSVQIRRWSLEVKTQVEEICQKRGINNFVLDVQSDAELFEAMEHLKKLGAFSRVLPENRDIVLLLEKQFSSLQPSDAYLKARPAQVRQISLI
jgi:dihydroorotase-like cyclic amidohydrolase